MKTKRKEPCNNIHHWPTVSDLSRVAAESRILARLLGLSLLTPVCKGPYRAGHSKGRAKEGQKGGGLSLSWLVLFGKSGKG